MNIPRKHHYQPVLYLKGFTKNFSSEEQFWVTDFRNKNTWQCSPLTAARETDFNKCELGSDTDPMWLERILGEEIEPEMAKVLAFIIGARDIPSCGMAYGIFLSFVALSRVRGAAVRDLNTKLFDFHLKELLRKDASRDNQILNQIKDNLDKYDFDVDRKWHIKTMLDEYECCYEICSLREWTLRVVADGIPDLVCSDSPVGVIPLVDGEIPTSWSDPKGMIVLPLNRRTVAIGLAKEFDLPEFLDTRWVAFVNASTIQDANQIYRADQHLVTLKGQDILYVGRKEKGEDVRQGNRRQELK